MCHFSCPRSNGNFFAVTPEFTLPPGVDLVRSMYPIVENGFVVILGVFRLSFRDSSKMGGPTAFIGKRKLAHVMRCSCHAVCVAGQQLLICPILILRMNPRGSRGRSSSRVVDFNFDANLNF